MHGTVVITGGGTGGHLNVAKEFIDAFYKRGITPIFVGSENGKDKEWFARDFHIKKCYFLKSRGVVNKDFKGKALALFDIAKEVSHCLDLFSTLDVKTVISVGGYSAAPASMAAILKSGCKLYIHEQNSVTGKLNHYTKRFASEFFSSYDLNSKVKDYPVKMEYFNEARIRQNVKTIIFLGGSHGAAAINNYALELAPSLNKAGIKIIHQTGKNDFNRVVEEYSKLGISLDIFAFDQKLHLKMSQADFAVSRAGASTLWELAANAIPTLFIPYPSAAGDHQFHNAAFLRNKGLCFVAREKELHPNILIKCLKSNIEKMSKGLTDCIMYDSVESMIDIILEQNQ